MINDEIGKKISLSKKLTEAKKKKKKSINYEKRKNERVKLKRKAY
jgi:hypothetical protein